MRSDRTLLVSLARAVAHTAWWFTLAAPAHGAGTAQVATEPVQPTPVAPDAERGRRLYADHCAQCHGDEGKGDGPAADFVYPRPRDFTLALFKVRSTLSGQLPTDHDLFHVISKGLPGTSMPAWEKFLSDSDRWQLVHYVKTFDSMGLFKEEPPKEQVRIDTAPKITADLVARGKEVYRTKKCWQCHGNEGRGDGPSADRMKDDWGDPIRPVNFTKGWVFRAGTRVEDIYRTFTTGFNGTPMPSFVESIAEDDRWALAAYVKSLVRPLATGEVIRARRHAGELPRDPFAAAWESADHLDALLAGQIIVEPRWFKPAHDVIGVRALYSERELAILLVWDDGTHNTGAGGKPPDQAALQLPLAAGAGAERPYFLLGDRAHPVDQWRWSAAQGLTRTVYAGHDHAAPRAAAELAVEGAYRDGQYRVLFRRALQPAADGEPAFAPGAFIPIAFQLWDGEQGEQDLKMALSAWHLLLLEPPTPMTAYAGPLGIGFIVLAGQVWLARRMRAKRRTEGKR
jgi:DMSO reductase family type II enzyme heme b subunit